MEKLDARAYLVSKGFTPGKRGRFSVEQIAALREAGYPVKDPKPRGKVTATPLA